MLPGLRIWFVRVLVGALEDAEGMARWVCQDDGTRVCWILSSGLARTERDESIFCLL